MPTKNIPAKCEGCGQDFESRNGVFRHLKETNGACLPPESYHEFKRYVFAQDRQKVLLLYGYLALPDASTFKNNYNNSGDTNFPATIIANGQDAATKLLQTLEEQISLPDSTTTASTDDTNNKQCDTKSSYKTNDEDNTSNINNPKINRSYANTGRNVEMLQQDDGTCAITEVLRAKLPAARAATEDWLANINALLAQKGYPICVLGRLDMVPGKFNAEMDVTHRRIEYLLPADFLAPGYSSLEDFFASLPSFVDGNYTRDLMRNLQHDVTQEIIIEPDSIQTHCRDKNSENNSAVESSLLEEMNLETSRPNKASLTYLYSLKKIMQSLSSQVVDLDAGSEGAVLEKDFHKQKRKRQKFKSDNKRSDRNANKKTQDRGTATTNSQEESTDDGTNKKTNYTNNNNIKSGRREKPDEKQESNNGRRKENGNHIEKDESHNRGEPFSDNRSDKKGTKVLKRRRFHNFSPRCMAHDFFAYRRLDRLYHRATLRFPDTLYDDIEQSTITPKVKLDRNRPFLAVSISGDKFLHGQACRVIGVLIALSRGLVDGDFVDCVFDEKYPHLVPTPEAPTFAMYAGEAFYTSWEGKMKKILTPRECDAYQDGWNNPGTLRRVYEWQSIVREEVAKAWLLKGVDPKDGRLLAEKKWTEEVLKPWAAQARKQVEDYRRWKKNPKAATLTEAHDNTLEIPMTLPSLASIDASVPALYADVLKCLRDADASGLWPTTTAKRQMVMISTPSNETNGDDGTKKSSAFSSLSMAHMVARSNKGDRSSGYDFKEGEGGASGSFSVGAMPGGKCGQPKANKLFPELMKAAFELERALLPDRESSSTIAINRNTQFRPHTDSGAGAGQSTSLIVALGNFVGGELVVEGKKEDIRYKPVEFNGWKQRHWVMPFHGERYSLVWFTPKGCEGIHGIDLKVED